MEGLLFSRPLQWVLIAVLERPPAPWPQLLWDSSTGWEGARGFVCTSFPGPHSLTWQPPPRTERLPNKAYLILLSILLINMSKYNLNADYPGLFNEEERELVWRSICFRDVAAGASLATGEAGLWCLLLEQEMRWKENAWKERVWHTQGLCPLRAALRIWAMPG